MSENRNEQDRSGQNGSSQQERDDRRRLSENVDEIVGEVNETVRAAIVKGVDVAESVGERIGENIRDTVQGVRGSRDNVVMVRVDKASLDRLDELVEAGIMGSRSEAAAFLIGEGVKARQPLFDRIAEKIQQIRDAKEELRRMVDDEGE